MKSKSSIPAFVPKAPDAIMAEVWRIKQQINADSDYDIDKLLARIKRQHARLPPTPPVTVPRKVRPPRGTLCQEPEQAQSVPDWHQQVLGQRLAAMEDGVETVTPWQEAKERIRQRTRPQKNLGD